MMTFIHLFILGGNLRAIKRDHDVYHAAGSFPLYAIDVWN